MLSPSLFFHFLKTYSSVVFFTHAILYLIFELRSDWFTQFIGRTIKSGRSNQKWFIVVLRLKKNICLVLHSAEGLWESQRHHIDTVVIFLNAVLQCETHFTFNSYKCTETRVPVELPRFLFYIKLFSLVNVIIMI